VNPRDALLDVWRAALAAGDPAPLLRASLALEAGTLIADRFRLPLVDVRRVVVLGCGKAGGAMAQAAESILGDRVSEGFVVVKDGCLRPTETIRIVEARHPVPDTRGQAAVDRLLELAGSAGADDVVVFLVSGGGSALTPAPAPPITLEEKQAVTRLLLAAGATIGELNAVRKHLSRFKGGQLARVAAPARVVTLALSDVIDDPLDVIASGPTAPDPTTFAAAKAVLQRRGVLDEAPASVRERLRRGTRGEIAETPKPGDPLFDRVANVIIGNNALVTDAAIARATALGLRVEFLTRALEGEARDVARQLVARARGIAPGTCLVAGGETTVTVRGRGSGGRCQEFALAAAIEMAGASDLVALAAGTDGTDGPTDAAGGIVDGGTVSRGAAKGLDARRVLDDNDAGRFLTATGDLVVTGPTNTNLLDLYLLVRTEPV
jgi:glycerate 2-kinase